jgi:hypothetical protein
LAAVSERLQAYGRINRMATITATQIKASSTEKIRGKAKKLGKNKDGKDDIDMSTIEVNSEDMAGSQKIIYDADNALGVVLNEDKPRNKMFVHITKARDNENGKTIELDFDGKVGRVSDPQISASNIQTVDDLVFDTDISEDELSSEEDLFNALADDMDNETDETEETTTEPIEPEETENDDEDIDDSIFGDI